MNEVITALISAISAFLVTLFMNLQGRNQFFSNIVSRERMLWIKDMRELCTTLCSVCEQYDEAPILSEQYTTFLKARNGILIRLDPKGTFASDDDLIEWLEDKDFKKVKENIPKIRKTLIKINKLEWDVVKQEAGNNRWIKRKIEKMRQNEKSCLIPECKFE